MIWAIYDNQSVSTHISNEGVLKIGEDEPAGLISVEATSAIDPTKQTEILVRVVKTPMVHVSFSKEVLYSGDNLPELYLAEGDTPGTLFFDAGQELMIGEHDYSWTYIPNDLETYASLKGSVTLDVKENYENREIADTVIQQINNLPIIITLEHKEEVDKAQASYEALSNSQKRLIPDEILQKLTEAINAFRKEEQELNQKEADKVSQEIISLPDTDSIGIDQKSTIELTQAAYERLTEEQKQLIPEELLRKLEEAISAVKVAEEIRDKEIAENVTQMIIDLPITIGPDQKDTVAEVQAAFDALTIEQQKLIPSEIIQKLYSAIADLEKYQSSGEQTNPEKSHSEEVNYSEKSHAVNNGSVTIQQVEVQQLEVLTEQITVTKKPTIKKPVTNKNKITVNWSHFKHSSQKTKKIWKKIKKVQIQCATDKTFTNIIKTSMVGKNKTKAVVKGLRARTTYFVRVRYYDGTGYSKWSSIKKIKTKK